MADQLRVGARIKAERVRNGMSLSQVSELTGISKAYLVRLETNENANPSLEMLHRLAQAFDVTVADLLGRPRISFEPDVETIPPALRAFADEDHISVTELR